MPNNNIDERVIDEALAESFPASDPPYFIGGGAKPGAPRPQKKPRGQFGQDYGSPFYTPARATNFRGSE